MTHNPEAEALSEALERAAAYMRKHAAKLSAYPGLALAAEEWAAQAADAERALAAYRAAIAKAEAAR